MEQQKYGQQHRYDATGHSPGDQTLRNTTVRHRWRAKHDRERGAHAGNRRTDFLTAGFRARLRGWVRVSMAGRSVVRAATSA
jgi:hypothetical protein